LKPINDITHRLRGQYAMGPHLPNGEPEFGWTQFEAPPLQHEAADEIERLRGIIRVNGLRWGADHPDIDALIYPAKDDTT